MQSLHLLVLGAVLLPRLAGGTTADDVCPPGADPCVLTRSLTVTPASMLDFGNRAFQIASGRRLTVNDLDTLIIRARTVTLQTGAAIGGPAGSRMGSTVDIVATGDIQLQRSGGSIDLAADVTAGAARLTAGGNITADGDLIVKGTPGDGGRLTLCAGGTVTLTGTIRVSGGGDSLGGDVTVAAGGSVVASGPIIDASGGLGGGSIDLEAGVGACPISGTPQPMTAGSSLSVTATLDVSGTGGDGSGGCVDLAAAGNVTIGGMIAAQGAGSSTPDGGGSGGELQIDAGGSIEIDQPINVFGGGPNGEGGMATLSAALDIIQNQSISIQGIGSGGFGGDLEMDADRLLRLGALIDAHGGLLGAGGGIDLSGGSVEASAKIDVSGDGGGILIDSHPNDLPAAAGPVTVSGDLNADGGDIVGNLIEVDGCDVTLTGSLSVDGAMGENLLEASAQLTVQGGLSALPDGKNVLAYRDPAKVPVVMTSRSIAPPYILMQDSTLPPCRGPVVPVCGNGILEGDEECDNGDTKDCDGCSSTCRFEVCGNGRKECNEECDDGNVVDGDSCDTNCTLPRCGNRIVDPGEACDDGNTDPNDGCDNCQVTGCGDGQINRAGEECDDGPLNGTPGDPCDAVCLLVRCGNNILESGEECDDGNTTSCDGCAPGCRLERCGDGIRECGEACDLGAANGTPGAGCNTSCQRCSLGSGDDCPCGDDFDCHPLGRCAGFACEAGLCVMVPTPDCNDGNACTTDSCDPVLGCQHSNNTAPCSDGNACTTLDACSGGRCVGGPPLDCDDGDLCTDDTCDAVSGCAHQSKTGFATITCRLDTIDLDLQQSGRGDTASKVRSKLGKLLASLRATLGNAAAAQGNPKRASKLLRASGKQLRKLAGVITAAAKKDQIASSLAGELASAAAGATTANDALRASLTPSSRGSGA